MLENPSLTERLRDTLKSARALAQVPTLCPGLQLYLLNPDFSRSPLSAAEQSAVLDKTAFWSFCWPAGQVLARLILDQPELVQGRRVVDLGCGSGIVAIAAALAGAAEVLACDHDEDALEATRRNAELNRVELQICGDWQPTEPWDLILLADVLYDPQNLALLEWCQGHGRAILAADCRVLKLPPQVPGVWSDLGRFHSTLVPDLDWNDEFREVQVYAWGELHGTLNAI